MSVQVVKLERPNPRQEEFLKCEKKYVAFGGARGGGKSWAVRTKAVLMALKYPGIRILLVRRTMPELESNHLRFLRRQLAGVAEYKAVSRQLVFPGGSVLELGYCACDGDMDRYQGAEFDVICIDEATQLKEEWLRQFAACLRGVNEFPNGEMERYNNACAAWNNALLTYRDFWCRSHMPRQVVKALRLM